MQNPNKSFTFLWGLCWAAQLGFSLPRKTLMEALSAWILLKPWLLLAPGRWWVLASPSLSTITLLSRLMQLIPQLSSQFDSPSVEHCNADRFYERRTRPLIGRAEVNPASYWPQRDVSKLTCWFGSLLHFHPLTAAGEQSNDVAREISVAVPMWASHNRWPQHNTCELGVIRQKLFPGFNQLMESMEHL